MDRFWALAFPLVLATVTLESWVARARGRDAYRFAESIANLGGSTLFRLSSAFLYPVGVALYAGLYRHRLVELSTASAFAWIVGFLWVDLTHYCWHRLSHTVNVLWAMHGVHHQSEDLNFGAALRNSVLDGVVRRSFHLSGP
jgi:sterol desaturase/sphingolipid hydroxylase (fatty acid hydroxylase superfamily)